MIEGQNHAKYSYEIACAKHLVAMYNLEVNGRKSLQEAVVVDTWL